MRNLLVRLIGENIDLQFHLDPNLGLIKMDPEGRQGHRARIGDGL
jgi:hypothetical protein